MGEKTYQEDEKGPIERIHLHPITLAFTGPLKKLEAPFQLQYFDNALSIIRVTLLFAAFLYGVFGLLDAYLVPEKKSLFWAIRYFFICPLILTLFLLTFFPIFRKIMQPAIAFVEVLGGMGIIWMTVVAPPPANYSYYAGIILIIIVGYTAVKLRFVWASPAGWILVITYNLSATFLTHTPAPVLLNNNFFLISANLIGMLACYLIEFHQRRDYYTKHLLELEQDKVRQAKDLLEERVRQRTKQLMETNQKLEREIEERHRLEEERERIRARLSKQQRMESIGLMAGGVAHDLNNILSGIVTYPDLILRRLPKDSELWKYVEAIKDTGERAAAVVADLLTVARGIASEKEVININELVKNYLSSPEYKNLLSCYPRIHLTFNPAPDLPPCKLSKVHIQKVLMNLVNNAYEAIGEEGTVTIRTGTHTITPDSSSCLRESLKEGNYVVLEIQDDGPGISKEDLHRIFEPFYSKKIMGRSGTGLGLTVVWNTIQDHEGTILVESGKGQGTTFTIYLPASKESEVPKPLLEESELTGKGKILIVDDEPLQREITHEILAHLGYEVVTAESGRHALDYLENNTVDLVLLDMLMPGMDGLETFQEIIKLYPHQKTIIVSGYSESEKVNKAMELGVAHYIKKPFSLTSLGIVVKKVLAA